MDQDWRKAIEQYDEDIADGKIKFEGADKFADVYQGKAEADADLAEFVTEHTLPC